MGVKNYTLQLDPKFVTDHLEVNQKVVSFTNRI